MIPGEYSTSLYRGDSWGITVKPTTPDGTPIDVSGWTAIAQVRAKYDSTDVLATITTAVSVDGIALSLSPTETSALHGKPVWDLQTTTAEGLVRTLLAGTFTIVSDVTRVAP